MGNWTKDVALQFYYLLVKLGKVSSKTLSKIGSWIKYNFKSRFVIVGSVTAMLVLALLFKFLFSINSKKDEVTALAISNKSGSSRMLESDSINTLISENARYINNNFIICTYYGTIGDKEFKLTIDTVVGDKIMGYNVTGTRKRPVEGNIMSKRTESTGSGGSYTIFNVKLKEPGDDQMDGEFNIELWVWISEIDRHGYGNWKAKNGKLSRHISIVDKKNKLLNQSDSSADTTKVIDSLIQVEGTPKPRLSANKVQVASADATYFNQRVQVRLNSLIREKPSQDAKPIKTASKGKVIQAMEKTANTEVITINGVSLPYNWYKVSYNSSNGNTYVGWIYGGYLELK